MAIFYFCHKLLPPRALAGSTTFRLTSVLKCDDFQTADFAPSDPGGGAISSRRRAGDPREDAHAKIGELTLTNDFLEGARQGRIISGPMKPSAKPGCQSAHTSPSTMGDARIRAWAGKPRTTPTSTPCSKSRLRHNQSRNPISETPKTVQTNRASSVQKLCRISVDRIRSYFAPLHCTVG